MAGRPLTDFRSDLAELGLESELSAIAKKHGALLSDLPSSRHFKHIHEARLEAMLFMKSRFPSMGFPAIAAFFGRKSHGTAYAAARKRRYEEKKLTGSSRVPYTTHTEGDAIDGEGPESLEVVDHGR